MAKKSKTRAKGAQPGPTLFTSLRKRRYRVLILPRVLREEADRMIYRDEKQAKAHAIIKKWIDLQKQGHLAKKETALDADFLHEVFGEALGYKSATESPDHFQLQRNFTVQGVGTADGALGEFTPKSMRSPTVVIELKGADADLDIDKFNGRTPVQQCWDYLNALEDCPWGIVSNFVTTRLYHRYRTSLSYQEFHLKDLEDEEIFRQFYCLFERGGLLPGIHGQKPRAMMLLEKSVTRQREVGDELYRAYSENRLLLIEHLHFKLKKSMGDAIKIAQKILDRIIFIAFCEDRDLLPEKCIATAYSDLPVFKKVTNPRWQNFLSLFMAIDQGHESPPVIINKFNGNLFKHDPDVDDLQLDDDPWTNFFNTIGSYDFRDEINVDVLGHLFEKSIGELEQLRRSGLFAVAGPPSVEGEPAMPKSPERKRFGIYYTPPEFTTFIVRNTVEPIIDERLAGLRETHGLDEDALNAEKPSKKLLAFWKDALGAVKEIKVCDPACGSGAFLIQAYDLLEERYTTIVQNICFHDGAEHDHLHETIPELILKENLFGIDLSPQGVEITQLALWIRSARQGKTLADLSHNIVLGNSLVTDKAVDPHAIDWRGTFPALFAREGRGGFDAVVGNPPWERLKLQEREFFAFSAPKIAGAVSAAKRRELIAALEAARPDLFAGYTAALAAADRTLSHVRNSGEFPLTAKGDINTYMLFAELASNIVAPQGRVGLLIPSGIATDDTTKDFFTSLIESKSLICLYDFENRLRIFPDVDGRFKFSIVLFGGAEVKTPQADFVFFAHEMEDLAEKKRHIKLSSADIALLNPNTRTCPIFRSRHDAELTKEVYKRVPVLIDKSRKEGGNPWGVKFVTMFHQTNDAELFHAAEKLQEMGCRLTGNRWTKGKRTFLPLYEAKMIQAYDHRAASVKIEEANWMRQGQTEATTLVEHQNPEFVAQPRWWVDEAEVARVLKESDVSWFVGFKDITSPTNERTMISAVIPRVGLTNHFPIMLAGASPRLQLCLVGNLNSVVLDYVTRQKIGGVTLNFFIVQQLPIFPPDQYAERCPWNKRQTLEKWISDRVLKLTCTANDMKPLAEAAGFDPPVHKWKEAERAEILAELDAAFFHLYGMARDDVEYILGTFSGTREDPEQPGMFAGPTPILEAYDNLSKASGK